MIEEKLIFGCIADDFTGAGDVASFLTAAGMKTLLFNGFPDKIPDEIPQAIVIALKTRTAPIKDAVDQTVAAARWLKDAGAEQLYLKYCSTFDSTKEGNIGPASDALLEVFGLPYTILCPSLPVNKRTVKGGRLFVNGVPLNESPMINHPLTPMWDDRIKVLMEAQSRYQAFNISKEELKKEQVTCQTDLEHYYLIPDYYEDSDALAIVERFGNLPLLTGGSGLIPALAKYHLKKYGRCSEFRDRTAPSLGEAVILAGSCSEATLEQIAEFKKSGGLTCRMDPEKLMNVPNSSEELIHFLDINKGNTILLYSSATSMEVRRSQMCGGEAVSDLLEQTTASIAAWAVENGWTRIIVAGGETSGAVTRKLGYRSFRIGRSVAPGVPILIPVEAPYIRLVLKSGNFGQPDFFEKAVRMTAEEADEK